MVRCACSYGAIRDATSLLTGRGGHDLPVIEPYAVKGLCDAMNVEHFKWTNEERVNEVADWLADYRMEGELWVLGALEGLVIGLALATRHPEYLHALVQAICASEDYDLEELPDGHSWLEHQEMTDLLVAENPWENEETGC